MSTLTQTVYKARIAQIEALSTAIEVATEIDNDHTVAALCEMRKRLTDGLADELAALASDNADAKDRSYYARDVWVALAQYHYHKGDNPYLCLTHLAWEVGKLSEPPPEPTSELV